MPDNCHLITLDVESVYTKIDHTKGLQAVRDVIGNHPLYGPVIELLNLSVKSKEFLLKGEWFIQTVGTSMGNDWTPHYIDIYMAKFKKEALLKCPLKPHTYYRYLEDVFIIWPHGKETFSVFLNSFNIHEPRIKFKYFICIDSVILFKDSKQNKKVLT